MRLNNRCDVCIFEPVNLHVVTYSGAIQKILTYDFFVHCNECINETVLLMLPWSCFTQGLLGDKHDYQCFILVMPFTLVQFVLHNVYLCIHCQSVFT